ncbi:hypothetical protein F66182_6228 [Fusarium sp. NRRL 66182]|nr:hypothetical protein F66182_6228 [Fusarium sp. NRRL 66182]
MHFSKLILAVLPALALANEGTTTETSTAVVTKTYFLSQVHTVTFTGVSTTAVHTSVEITHTSIVEETHTSVIEEKTTFLPVHNSTTPVATPRATSTGTTGSTGDSSQPSEVPENAGSAVAVGKFAMVGVAGMVAAAFL